MKILFIQQFWEVIDNHGVGFRSSFLKKVGDGTSTLFWEYRWVGNDRLCDTFNRLYNLESNKRASIRDRGFGKMVIGLVIGVG